MHLPQNIQINPAEEDAEDLPEKKQTNPQEDNNKEEDKYEETKKAMGYYCWSVKLVGNDLYVSLDGHELDMYLKVKGIEKTFGKVYDVELFTPLLIKVKFEEDFIVSYSQTQGYSINQIDQEDRSPFKADQMVEISEAGNDTKHVQGKKGVNDQEKNSFIEVANTKVIGTFKMPIEQLDFSSDNHSIRKIEPSHCREIITKMKISFLNGDVVSLPNAIGMVPSSVTSEDIESGKVKVEIIDGNHTLFALRELHEEFPSEKCFESRKVIVYQDLSRSEVYTMALLGNEKAGTVQYTKPIDKLMIMRKVLEENFEGKFSSAFQDHIYKIFNAVCPDNHKEQERRRKNLQSIIRLSTMDSSLLSKVQMINSIKPGHSPYVYRDLGSLTVIQANEILQHILDIHQKEKN
ncbi:unnamed protein product [Mytilus coruscus]|uniref:Uncharacterized protein n=1 Tax=Mytilus coruscus TaxID=42192 RepID=A0A6J8BJ03_MYTCO|nr:unnamed protein product [Mytilus coruscus]